MSCDYDIPVSLLRFLGACVYGDAKTYYAGLDEAGRAGLERQGDGFGMNAWFYRYLHDVLPEEKRAEYRKCYQERQAKALMDAQELNRLCRVLAGYGFRFVPIKGADLAYRLYPDAALRSFADWDFWFHPDDCERALAVLAEDGWRIPKCYSDDHEAVRKSSDHHYSMHIRGRNRIEPHFMPAHFEAVDPYEAWEWTMECPGGDGADGASCRRNSTC